MEQIKLTAKDGKQLAIYIWQEVNNPLGVIQLVHGSAEHAYRYNHFARFLNSQGWIVIGNDLRGHGLTATNKAELGYFGANIGWDMLVNDLKVVNDLIKTKYQSLPIVMLGHSMGSFLARHYSMLYSYTIQALILSGTAYPNKIKLWFARFVTKLITNKKNYDKPNQFIYNLSYKTFNYKINEKNNEFAWLTRDKKIQQNFKEDPLTGQVFTTSAFGEMFYGLDYICHKKNIIKTRFDLPIFLIAGLNDPVGNLGKEVRKIAKKYRAYGLNDVRLKLYAGMRHEILNEIGKEQVYDDVLNFINNINKKHTGVWNETN